ncbi:MAG: EVE domain-containing protein [Cyanobacteria bacterium J06641_5]
MKYWLLKSEPSVYSINDLEREQMTVWDGVRNYQARNFLRQMRPGDMAFFYHSNAKPPGIAGLMRVTAANVVDPSQFDASSPYYDPKATEASPRWQTVNVCHVETFSTYIPLASLKTTFTGDELLVVRRGNRLSVMPVAAVVAEKILRLAHSHQIVGQT